MNVGSFEELLGIESVVDRSQQEQVDIVGSLFDLSYDNGSVIGIEHAFKLSGQVDASNLPEELFTVFQYDLSNGWSYLRKLKYGFTKEDWNFQTEELTKEIFCLRTALVSPGFQNVPLERQCQIYTNLGNSFSYIGRFVEAQEYWNKAIDILPSFSMAIGNKANGLYFYGRLLYDNIHVNLFLLFAYHHFKDALRFPEYLHDEALHSIQQHHDWLHNYVRDFPGEYTRGLPNLDNFDMGDDQELRSYRQWCLDNKMYINPLNDLGAYTDACHDCLNLPTLILPANRPPVVLDLFNQIKQEFATARYSYYYSSLGLAPHISDVDVVLVETMQTVRYSFYVEQLKIAFRMAYSILDKIAFLLNDYLELQIDSFSVSFKSLWYTGRNAATLRSFFANSENWALRGLYWLSKDLYEKRDDFDTVLDPAAKEIALIRNFIEHKGIKVLPDIQFSGIGFKEADISFTISRGDLQEKTLNLLKLARATVMYTALAIAHEEQKKDRTSLKAIPIGGSAIPLYMKT